MAINYSHPTQKVEKLVLLKNKRIIFISNSVIPEKDAGGGSVVVFRHLKRLKDAGYQIMIIYISSSPAFNKPFPVEFDCICLNKKNWYPPLRRRTPLLTNVRIYFTLNSLLSQVKFSSEHDILLGVLGEVSNLLTLSIKNLFKVPYYLFYHDDTIFNRYALQSLLTTKHVNNILKNADYIFPVSDSLTSLLKAKGINNAETLYPIPEGYNGPFKAHNNYSLKHLQFCYAGMIMMHVHFDILDNISQAIYQFDGSLYCFTGPLDEFQPKYPENIIIRDLLPTINQLQSFIINNIDVVIVFYSFDLHHEPRMASSFPSKFVEYAQLGIPILLIAPAKSSLGMWASKNNWLSYVNSDDPDIIAGTVMKFKNEEYWKKCQQQVLEHINNEFNPDLIHYNFTEKILNSSTFNV